MRMTSGAKHAWARRSPALPIILAFALVLIHGAFGPAWRDAAAQTAADPYTVRNIAVDEEAPTLAQARDRAFMAARRTGLTTVLSRIGLSGDVTVDAIPDPQLESLVSGLQVLNERTGPGRYIADVTVAFRPDAVTALAARPAETIVSTQGAAALVLPIYRVEAGDRLFDSPNPWRDAWLDFDPDGRLLPILVPFGDLQDVAQISAASAVAGDGQALDAIAARYEAIDTVVAVADPNPQGLDVSWQRYGPSGGFSGQFSLDGNPGDAGLYREAVTALADRLDDEWRRRAAGLDAAQATAPLAPTASAVGQPVTIGQPPVTRPATATALPVPSASAVPSAPQPPVVVGAQPGVEVNSSVLDSIGPGAGPGAGLALGQTAAARLQAPGGVPTTVALASPQDWFRVRAALDGLPTLAGYEIIALSQTEAILRLDPAGSVAQLRAALAQRGVTLVDGAGAQRLVLPGAPSPVGVQPAAPPTGNAAPVDGAASSAPSAP